MEASMAPTQTLALPENHRVSLPRFMPSSPSHGGEEMDIDGMSCAASETKVGCGPDLDQQLSESPPQLTLSYDNETTRGTIDETWVDMDLDVPFSVHLDKQCPSSQGPLVSQGQADSLLELDHVASELYNPQLEPGSPQGESDHLNFAPDVSPGPELPPSMSKYSRPETASPHMPDSHLLTGVPTPTSIQIGSSITESVPPALTSNYMGGTQARSEAHEQSHYQPPLMDELEFNPW